MLSCLLLMKMLYKTATPHQATPRIVASLVAVKYEFAQTSQKLKDHYQYIVKCFLLRLQLF